MSDVKAAVGAAIESAVANSEPGFTTRWVAAIESVDHTGQRGLWVLASANNTAWDTLGLLDYAQTVERAAVATQDEQA